MKQDYQQIMTVLLDLKEDVGRIEQKVDNVHEQAVKTNGRVTTNEREIVTIKQQLSENGGTKKAYNFLWSAFGGVVVSAFIWVLKAMK